MMSEQQFIKTYQDSWNELRGLLDKKHLSASELLRLHELFRGSSALLAQVQASYPHSKLYNELLPLVARAHSQIYRREQSTFIDLTKRLCRQVPLVLRQHWSFVLCSGLLLYGSMIFAIFLGLYQPDMITLFVPAEYLQIDYQQFDHRDWPRAGASSLIMTNNISVTFSIFALSLTGIGAPYILMNNGFMLGGVLTLAAGQSAALPMAAWLMPHGILELTAIVYSGAAGLLLLYSLLFPGPYQRRDALNAAGKDCVTLLALAVLMLIIAGVIEGFLSGSGLAPSIKITIGLATLVLVLIPWVIPLSPARSAVHRGEYPSHLR